MNNLNDANNHKGHRVRMKRRFALEGEVGFNDHELLELLLFYAIPRKNTNEIAHLLMERFGTIENMAEATVDELKLVDGVGDSVAVLLRLVLMLAKRYAMQAPKGRIRLNTVQKLVDYASEHTMGAVKELVYAAFMDDSLNLISAELVAVGSVNKSKPIIRTVVEFTILKRATSVALFHNHPNGCVEASAADIEFTSALEHELDIIGVNFVEHVIVGGGEFMPILKDIRRVDTISRNVNMEKFY